MPDGKTIFRLAVSMRVVENPDNLAPNDVDLTGGLDGFEGVGWLLEAGRAATRLQADLPDWVEYARVEVGTSEQRRWNLYKRLLIPDGFKVLDELDPTEYAPEGIMIKKYKRLESGVYV